MIKINRSGDDWQAIVKWANNQIAIMRAENDNDLDDIETTRLRGRIEFAKELLALGDEPEQKAEVATQSYID